MFDNISILYIASYKLLWINWDDCYFHKNWKLKKIIIFFEKKIFHWKVKTDSINLLLWIIHSCTKSMILINICRQKSLYFFSKNQNDLIWIVFQHTSFNTSNPSRIFLFHECFLKSCINCENVSVIIKNVSNKYHYIFRRVM